jgi:alpha-tubulin suppressor-like RCC1 family protein
LGHGDEENQVTPKLLEALRGERVAAVAAGGCHSLVLTEAGAVLSFGCGGDGRLGHGDHETQLTPKVVEALRCERVTAVSAGLHHSLVLTETGTEVLSFVYMVVSAVAWATATYEQNQLTPKVIEALRGEQVTKVIARTHKHSLCMLRSGRVFGCWGDLNAGEGLQSTSNRRRRSFRRCLLLI